MRRAHIPKTRPWEQRRGQDLVQTRRRGPKAESGPALRRAPSSPARLRRVQETPHETFVYRTIVTSWNRNFIPVEEPAPGGPGIRRGGAVLALCADCLGTAPAG